MYSQTASCSVFCAALPEDRLPPDLYDGRCGDRLRRREHGLPSLDWLDATLRVAAYRKNKTDQCTLWIENNNAIHASGRYLPPPKKI
jgi:hypothetical protein